MFRITCKYRTVVKEYDLIRTEGRLFFTVYRKGDRK